MREHKGKSLIALPSNYVAIDTETTGLDPEWDGLIEIAAVRVREGQIVGRFSSLVNPGDYVDEFITELTGITNEMLQAAPTQETVMPRFMEFIEDSILLAHNANFDINFLYDAAEAAGCAPLCNHFVDTMRISRKVFRELPHHRLSDIVTACGVSQSEAHRAEADARAVVECYETMRTKILAASTEDDFVKGFKPTGNHYANILANISATVAEIDETNPIFGKNVVFTGALSRMERKDAFQIVANLGGIPQDSITTKTNFLVIGNTDYAKNIKNGKTGKMKKAESYQKKGLEITILSENAFFDLISDFM